MDRNELEMTWQDPPSIYRGAPFWAWNAELKSDRLCRQIEQMHAAGMGGFFMHSRYGLKTPYLGKEWFECIAACVEKARQLGMKAYLYDEDRWPSGAAGGLVTRDKPHFRQHVLDAEFDAQPQTPPTGQDARNPAAAGGAPLGAFALELDAAGLVRAYRRIGPEEAPPPGMRKLAFTVRTAANSGWYNDGAYLDTMNPQAVEEFIRVTHEAYAARYRGDFGGVIPAVFTDEPEYGKTRVMSDGRAHRLQWTPRLPEEFRRRRGYDLLEHLPELACWLAGGEFSKVRHDYHRTMTELFLEAFSAPYGRWCARNGIAFSGHYMAEQTLGSQTDCIGAAMPHYEHQQWPGIDILTDQANELATARQCASVADQLSRQRVLSEMYGCTGWDWPLEGHKFVGDWQYAVGVNFRCQHLTWYSAAGGAKRDYPASIAWHSPWWKHYRCVEDYFGRLSLMLTQGRPVRDVLVIHPVESAWGIFTTNRPDGSRLLHRLQDWLREIIYTLSGRHYDWDFGDESLLARHGRVRNQKLKVGSMSYGLVIVPPCVTLRSGTAALLEKFVAAGGRVLFVGDQPDRLDGQPSARLAELARSAHAASMEESPSAVEALVDRRVSITEDGLEAQFVWSMLRAVKGGRLLFIQSHDRKAPHRVRLSVEGRPPVVLWDALSGQRRRLKASRTTDGRVELELHLPPTGSALLSLGLPVRDAAALRKPPRPISTQSFDGPFDIELTEPNTLPLDYCQYRFEGEDFSQPMPTLKADAEIRRRFGLGDRLGRDCQPWYLYAMGTVDNRPRGRCEMKRTFHVSQPPTRCLLAIERPEDFAITVNGRGTGEVAGWWVDEDVKTIDIAPLLRQGDNELLLTFDYRPDMDLEDVYLLGEFGVSCRHGPSGDSLQGPERAPLPAPVSCPPTAGNVTLVAAPRSLRLGSWVGQGLDFYGGGVKYRLSVEKPAGRRRAVISLPAVTCTAAAIHVNEKTFVLPWAPFEADVTDAMVEGTNEIAIEVIGGRKNVLGPLHVPWEAWTGPEQFNPANPKWTDEYLLTNHGLMAGPVVRVLAP